MKLGKWAGLIALCAAIAPAASGQEEKKPADAGEEKRARLGERLFSEKRLSHPGGNFLASCASCHKAPGFADSEPLSLIPARAAGEKKTTAVNTPTLLDAGAMKKLGHDGRWSSLEEAILAHLTGPEMGWAKEDRPRLLQETMMLAFEENVVDRAATVPYIVQFGEAFGGDPQTWNGEEAQQNVLDALAAYLRTIKTTNTAPWDAFANMNRVPKGPSKAETAKVYAGRVFGRLANQEGRQVMKLVDGFDVQAYEGFKIFYRAEGEKSAGNCVACHVPPAFTDFAVHPARLGGEKPGPMKTPTLRNPGATGPYLSDGSAKTIEDALKAKIKASESARADAAAGWDPEIANIWISEADIPALAAYLKALNEVPQKDFRSLLLSAREHTGEVKEGQ